MISTFVFASAERAPEQLAIVANGRRLTYGELARSIEAMAQAFESQRVAGPGYAIVAINDLLEHWIVSLALRELGLTTVPTPSVEAADAIGLPNVRLAATHPDESWPGLEALCARRGWPLAKSRWAGAMARPVETGRRRADAIGEHVLQTSATTGAPKLVLERRRIEAEAMAFLRDVYDVGERSKLAQFNFGAWTGLGYRMTGCAWSQGGAVVFGQGDGFFGVLNEPGLTHAALMPDQAMRVLAAPLDAFAYQPDLAVRIGGATPTEALVEGVKRRLASAVYNTIGATEAPTIADTRIETTADRLWHRPIPACDVQVVDEEDRPLPTGATGRLRVSTRFGPDSYLENPDATAEFFRDGCFLTGDLARFRDDGRLTLMGRVTDVINIMGQKVSPAPYEDALCAALDLTGVCLFSHPDETGDEVIHVVIESAEAAPLDRLAVALKRTLSGFPRAVVHQVRALPRNDSGKLLRAEVRRRLTSL